MSGIQEAKSMSGIQEAKSMSGIQEREIDEWNPRRPNRSLGSGKRRRENGTDRPDEKPGSVHREPA
jgi:hypothetical protein